MPIPLPPEFILFCSQYCQLGDFSTISTGLASKGLNYFSVANLKNIWKRLVPLLHGLPFVTTAYNSTLRKYQVVVTLMSLIYADYPTCKTWRPDVLAILRARMTARGPVPAVSTTTTASAQRSAAVPPQRQYQPVAPRPTASIPVPRPATASTTTTTTTHRTGPPLNDHVDPFDRMITTIMDPGVCPAPTPPPTTNSNHHPPDSVHHPSNTSIVAQLRRMGFGINDEIEASIRRLRSSSTMITAHACMLQIIAQREEREEARQMDEARKQSEITRKAESARRRLEIKQQRERDELAADWNAWKVTHFSKSVLVKHNGVRTAWDAYLQKHPQVKKLFWKLLQLEQQALKWYGSLPRPYLESLCRELVSTKRRSEFLTDTIALLEEQMYSLTNQDCEAPRLFRQYQGRSLGIAENDDGPEIIEIL